MPDNSFFARTDQLAEMVGDGVLKGEFAANREYAAVQHEKGWKSFMGTGVPKAIENQNRGGPKFVENATKEMFMDWYEDMADATLKGTLEGAMERAMKDYDDYLKERAPIDDGDLRNSGTYTVYDGERVASHKPSSVPYEAR